MAADPDITQERHDIVIKTFLKLSNIKKEGVPFHSKEYCIAMAAKKGFYKFSTAEKIIFNRNLN